MMRARIEQIAGLGILAASLGLAQPARVPAPATGAPPAPISQPDAQQTQQELSELFQHYPPSLRRVLALDPSLLINQSYLAPYPALASFLAAHPEVIRNPSYYIGSPNEPPANNVRGSVLEEMLTDICVLAGFALAVSLIAWLIRTFIDSRRWNRLSKIQTDVHTKILDRLSSNEDLLAYMQSPAGSKFLESTPIVLDPAPKTMSAPLSRILWTVQGGTVLFSAGVGLEIISRQLPYDASVPIHALGILAMALGIGFFVSAAISLGLSRQFGLLQRPPDPTRQG